MGLLLLEDKMRAPERLNQTRIEAPDREWLFHQNIELGKPIKQIAEETNIGQDTLGNWVREYHLYDDLPRPYKVGDGVGGTRFYGVTEKWLRSEYITQDKSAHQISDEIGTSTQAVSAWLRRFKIPKRTREQLSRRHSDRMSGKGNPAYKRGDSMGYVKRKALKARGKKCQWCGGTERLQVHHKDHDRTSNDLDNLMILCGLCNMLEAQIWHLVDRGRAEAEIRKGEILIRFPFT